MTAEEARDKTEHARLLVANAPLHVSVMNAIATAAECGRHKTQLIGVDNRQGFSDRQVSLLLALGYKATSTGHMGGTIDISW